MSHKFYVNKIGTTDYLGPYTTEEIVHEMQKGVIVSDDRVLEAIGQSHWTLKRSKDWRPLTEIIPASSIAHDQSDAEVVTNATSSTNPKNTNAGTSIGLLLIVVSVIAIVSGMWRGHRYSRITDWLVVMENAGFSPEFAYQLNFFEMNGVDQLVRLLLLTGVITFFLSRNHRDR